MHNVGTTAVKIVFVFRGRCVVCIIVRNSLPKMVWLKIRNKQMKEEEGEYMQNCLVCFPRWGEKR